MRIVFIAPASKAIVEQEVSTVEGIISNHGDHCIVPQVFSDHEGLVQVDGLLRKRTMWFFHNVNIWGPMVIVGKDRSPATVTVEQVRRFCRFVS